MSDPNCVIVTAPGLPINNCIRLKMPSPWLYIAVLVIGVLVLLFVAWAIYAFLGQNHGKVNYWMILFIVVVATIVSQIVMYMIM